MLDRSGRDLRLHYRCSAGTHSDSAADIMGAYTHYRLELRRDFVATDPAYFSDEYVGFDVVLPADVPWVAHACAELAPEFIEADD